jgi:membrane-bound lytic murein transglycosylase D
MVAAPLWHDDTTADTEDGETTAEASPNDVWQRIRNGFRVGEDASKNPLVAVHESWFAARPENVRRLAERSRPYLYHIVEELDRRAMPMEIALLPMIESAFNPKALSASAASGIWQFIPSTGRHYGLRQDTWYDGRGDFAAATNAALDYLGKLYLDFGDWQLALAAYNCGEGCVARAIRSNIEQGLPSDYASLSLPNETRHYVPKLLALKNLISESERHGIAIEQLPDQPYFNQVTIHASMDIHAAARLADMSSDEFIALNAAFPRKLIRSDTPVKLLVPVGKADTFQRNLKSGSWDTWQPYPAQKGERPAALAKRFDVSLSRLEEHNQLHTKNGKLVRAQTILVPVKGRGDLAARIREPAQPVRYTAKRGDTLHAIARRFDVSLGEIKAWNPVFRNSSKIRMGQAVIVRRP